MNHTAHWVVPPGHPAFVGHFPGTPILPGVVLLDVVLHLIGEARVIPLDRCEIRSVKFLSPVHPGDELDIQHSLSASGAIRFEILAGARKIARGSIVPVAPV